MTMMTSGGLKTNIDSTVGYSWLCMATAFTSRTDSGVVQDLTVADVMRGSCSTVKSSS